MNINLIKMSTKYIIMLKSMIKTLNSIKNNLTQNFKMCNQIVVVI